MKRSVNKTKRKSTSIKPRSQALGNGLLAHGILDTLREAVLVLDPRCRVCFANRAFYSAFHTAPERVLGWPLSELNGGMWTSPKFQQMLQGAADNIANFDDCELECEIPGVGKRTILAYGRVLNAGADPSGCILLSLEDVTLRKRLESRRQRSAVLTETTHADEARRLSEARMNGIVASAMDAIVSIDEEQRVVIFNAAAEKMFLCPAAEAIGLHIERFMPGRFRPSHAEHIRQFAQTGVTSRSMNNLGEIFGLRADGSEFPIEATISQVNVGGHRFFTAILRDISERKRADEQRQELNLKVLHQEKLAAVGLLSSGLAHEIGNPLASIQAICDNQLRKPLDPQIEEKVRRIRDQVVRIVKIVRQLVNFSRRETEVWRLCSLAEEIDSALSIARLSRTAKGVSVQLELEPRLPQTYVLGDQLAQVFLNLFVNAFDAMEEAGGAMTVKAVRSVGDRVRITVQDNGIGIPE